MSAVDAETAVRPRWAAGARLVRVARGLGGVVSGGVIVLMLVVVGSAILGQRADFPGPGVESIGWHVAAAVVAVSLQRFADRRAGLSVWIASAVTTAIAALLLWTQWWS